MSSVAAMGLGKQIKAHRIARGLTLEKLEQLSGVAVGTIHAIEARDSSRSQYFSALAKAMGISVEQLEGPPPSPEEVAAAKGVLPGTVRQKISAAHMEDAGTRIAQEATAGYGLTPILAWEHADDLPPGEYVLIPRLDLQLSAGNGKEHVDHDLFDKQPQAFRADWIRSERLKPSKLACMTAHGNSMEPTVFDGDSLVLDTSQQEVIDGKVYALWYEGGERVKRLFRLPGGGLRIKSDNPEFETIDMGPDYLGHVRIIGRVVHRSGKGGL